MKSKTRTNGRRPIAKIADLAAKAWLFALDTAAPPDPLVREIELMPVADFMARAAPAENEKRADGVRAIFKYKDPLVKAATLELKSYGNKKMARLLGAILLEHIGRVAREAGLSPPIIIPIPMTRKNQRERGWNQCELIGFALEKLDAGKTCAVRTDILYKVRQTGDQVGKSRSERFENLRDCFSVRDPAIVRGRDIIVFDDILTTGATLGEAAKALKNAGAARVFCVALAH